MLHFKALRVFHTVSETLAHQARLLNHACRNLVSPGLSCQVFASFMCNARIHPDSCTKMKALLSVLHFPNCANPLLFQNSDIFPWWFVWIFLFWKIFRQKPFRHSHPKQASNQMKWYMAHLVYTAQWFGFIQRKQPYLEVDVSGSF